MKKILVVDDIPAIRLSIRVILESEGYTIIEAENGLQGLEIIKTDNIDLVITDILMPDSDGMELLTGMQKLDKKPKCISISGGGNRINAEDSLALANSLSDGILHKPFQKNEIVELVEKIMSL